MDILKEVPAIPKEVLSILKEVLRILKWSNRHLKRMAPRHNRMEASPHPRWPPTRRPQDLAPIRAPTPLSRSSLPPRLMRQGPMRCGER